MQKKLDLFLFDIENRDCIRPRFHKDKVVAALTNRKHVSIKLTGCEGSSLLAVDQIVQYFEALMDRAAELEWEFLIAPIKSSEILASICVPQEGT